ncbi:hypothetical protein BK659_17285 [Pseudomonas brassicacearum]|uniref:Uncharacterized protein n=1 Tax=Pseudomonas brassicacearum TaxID=930166 RepID=A0A423H524_9PSED|nr:hypothetical protein [Pseudomonas brassicacearum]RON08310.1 hypothetical protein BK659_17285 [Pseudomonas brassicacearum]
MLYLTATAQDRGRKGEADTVHFQFYEDERLIREVVVTATDSGRQPLVKFARTYLKLGWFNAGDDSERYLQIFAQNLVGNGTPEAVRLHFHDEALHATGSTIAYKASALDRDNDGSFELILSSDVDNDGHADRTDRRRVKALAIEFLKIDAG